MSERAFDRIADGLREAQAIVAGEQPAASITMYGRTYVPKPAWMPIETAPKDGTEVHIARDRHQAVAFFRDGKWHLGCGICFDRPTHWMPLPTSPPASSPAPSPHTEST